MATEWKQTGERAFFAAANSRDGFHSYYDECLGYGTDHLYCVKGGPGTGKSRLLRDIAQAGERAGYAVETYYCSSDTTSLDGVLLNGFGKTIGVIDATAPHVVEPRLPGLKEDLVDLGQFWDSRALAGREHEILLLNEQKSTAYRMAYRNLAGAGNVTDNLAELMARSVDFSKLNRLAGRLLRDVPEGERFECSPALSGAISLQGNVRLDTYLRLGKRLCFIEDYFDTGYLLTRALLTLARERKIPCRVSHNPLVPDEVDAIFFENDGTVFLVGDPQDIFIERTHRPDRVISMRHMIDADAFRSLRSEARYDVRLREALLCGAAENLSTARQAHFGLEAIYSGAMDFAAKERFTGELIKAIFKE